MSGIDDAALVELAALAEAATAGPWWRSGSSIETEHVCSPSHGCWPVADTSPGTKPDGTKQDRDVIKADAAFIAAANPQTVAALVAEVQRLRTVEAAVRSLAAEWDVRHAEGDAMLGCPAGAGYYDLLGDELTHAMTAAALAAARTGEASDG